MAKEIFVSFGVDVDAVAGWLGSYGGEDSPCDISRGLFAGEVGSLRLLRLFTRWGIKTTWFVPGHSVETFPEQMQAVADAGHEIGMHGYSHENPVAMTPVQEEAIFDRLHRGDREAVREEAARLRRTLVGVRQQDQRAAAREGHQVRPQPDEQRLPPLLRPGRRPLDQDRLQPAPERLDDALQRGQETDLIEIPASWYLDDLPPMMFIKAAPNSHGFVSPRVIEELWRDQFDWVYREYDYAVFPLTIHPDVVGQAAGAAHAGAPVRAYEPVPAGSSS